MKNSLVGKPEQLKQVNLSAVRRTIKENSTATRSEISEKTGISVTTVRALLQEMLENREIVSIGLDESIGGRKAERYGLNKNRYFGIGYCIENQLIRYIVINICGEVCESGVFESCQLIQFTDEIIKKYEIKAIGIGAPGIVEGLHYINKSPDGEWSTNDIGEILAERYNLPVILENHLNAVALGIGRKCLKEKPCDKLFIAYVHFEKNCISAGFLSGGQIMRGFSNYAGEIGLFPFEKFDTLTKTIENCYDDKKYIELVVKVLSWICCIINPEVIALGGETFKPQCFEPIKELLYENLPKSMKPELISTEDSTNDYLEGIAYLTAEKIFTDVQLVKEKQ